MSPVVSFLVASQVKSNEISFYHILDKIRSRNQIPLTIIGSRKATTG